MNDAFVTADTSGVVTGLTAWVELAPGQHFNDGAVDARGRYWSATLDTGRTPINCLYRLDATGALQVMDEGLRAGNGIAWSPDDRTKHLNKSFCEILRAKSHNLPRARGAAFTISFAWVLMYLVDSGPRVIYAYDFDLASGFVSNRRELVRSLEPSSVPDGIAVDSEGYIWCAHWGGWKVVRYDPAGEVEREVTLSVQYPSSCTFGGANLDELFITSSCIRLDSEEKKKQPHAGDVFHLKTHTRGLSTSRFAG
jgi:sugar lactone lactonase YvrE